MHSFKIIEVEGCGHIVNTHVRTYVVYYEYQEKIVLLSLPSLFIKSKSKNSIRTSERYANVIKKFFSWYSKENNICINFWQNITNINIQEWQISRLIERDNKAAKSPSNKTIEEEALLVAEMYHWLSINGYKTGVNINKINTLVNFEDSDLLSYIKGEANKEGLDKTSISVVKKSTVVKESDFILMNDENIGRFAKGFSDPVYISIFYLLLCSGMRVSEIIQVPYIGEKKNISVRQYKQIDSFNKETDYIRIKIIGKGNKERSPKVPMEDWKYVCELYEPFLFNRRAAYKNQYNKACSNSILWINKKGVPVSAKMITSAFEYATKKTGIKITPHDCRSWYATTFIIKALGDRLDTSLGYNAAIDEELRNQLGHSNIRTTYMRYVKMARVFKHTRDGFVNEVFSKDNGFLVGINL